MGIAEKRIIRDERASDAVLEADIQRHRPVDRRHGVQLQPQRKLADGDGGINFRRGRSPIDVLRVVTAPAFRHRVKPARIRQLRDGAGGLSKGKDWGENHTGK